MKGYLELARERVVIFDGATGTNIQLLDLSADDFGGESLEGCNEALVLSRPELITDLHDSFFAVGVDVVETNTFGAFSTALSDYGISDKSYEINFKAAQLAREVASGYGTPSTPKFVAGSIGPGTKFPSLGQIGFKAMRDSYEVQCQGLISGGVDLILIETVYDPLSAKAAISGAKRAMKSLGVEIPIQIQVTIELTGRMLPGTELGAALVALEPFRLGAFGINCATGPKEMSEHLRYLSQHSPLPISCLPNAGLPSVVEGKMHYDLTPQELADFHYRFVNEFGVNIIGGCCGTTPEHLKAVVEKCSGLVPHTRTPEFEPSASSLYSSVTFRQENALLAIGERTNANGSKKFRDSMLSADWESCIEIAREQTSDGAHLIDLCVDYTGEDGVANMEELASRLATQSTLGLVIDSTEADVVETALSWIGGRPLINSVNLEEGDQEGTRLDKFFRLAVEYGAAVVCTCIDTQGQARTAGWKLDAAKAIYELAVNRYGLRAEDLFFDPLVLPISTGMEESRKDAIETIEGIRRIKSELQGCYTIIGLSNISFGLSVPAREVLNSVFLREATVAGLDAAIVHPSKILPLAKIPQEVIDTCLDLIYDRRSDGYDPLSKLIELFDGVDSTARATADLSSLDVRERLYRRIVDGNRKGLEADLGEALSAQMSALEIVNDVLLEGMKEVGELFGSGKMQLPFVLSSAETMKLAVAYLEPYMERTASSNKGQIVLATVKGDVHDIGKNLVDIILTNNGYQVHNLGIKVSISEMIDKAKAIQADALGMSGLLVKSTLIMRDNLDELNQQGLENIPVILGGAALTRTYVERDLRQVYKGRVFYGKDAFEGLRVMNKLMELKSGTVSDSEFGRKITERKLPKSRAERLRELPEEAIPTLSPEVDTDNEIFEPPFLGSEIVKGTPLEEIAPYLNETALFRNQWGYRPEKEESDTEFKTRIRSILRYQLEKAVAAQVLVPQVAYGYFPVGKDGNDLVVYSDRSRSVERTRFNFPRQREHPYLCIADFFRPSDTVEADFAAFHVVTMGGQVSKAAAVYFEENRYQDYLHLHGLGVEMAEALAEYWHHRIRSEWGFVDQDGPTLTGLFRQQYRGGRYSWGYPACPNLEDNAKVVELLGADRIGVEVSEGFQLYPEQTTTAIICHHPRSKYFIA